MPVKQPIPAVTVVTPSFNQAPFIRATIESVLAQDYPNLEYIIMDGGSTDATASIAAQYSSRLTWISEKDRGQSHAINKGFARAKGEIVAWLNSDDLLLPGAITRAVEAFIAAPRGIGAIYGEGYRMDREGRITGPFTATEPFNLWKLVYLSDYVLQQSTFFRRSAVAEVGWLDETLHYTMDWDLLIRVGKRFGLHYIPEPLGVLREYPEAKTSIGGRARIEEIRRVLERHTGLSRAPGYWTYALEELRSSRPFLRLPTAIPLMLIHRHAQGLYPDHWVAPRLKWMLPVSAHAVVVSGIIPDERALRGQTISAHSGSAMLGKWTVGPGAFGLRFSIPPEATAPAVLELRSSRYKRPRPGSEMSIRRMSWILKTIDSE